MSTQRDMQGLRQAKRRPASGEAGFTLIEVITSMMIMSVALMGMASGMAVAVSSDTHAGEQTRSLALASQKIEELKASSYANVQSEASKGIDAKGLDASGPYRRTIAVVDGAEGVNTKSVKVSVTYGAGREGTRTVVLNTVLYSGS